MLTHLPRFTHFSVYEKWQYGGVSETDTRRMVARLGSLGNRYKENVVVILGSLENRYKESVVARLGRFGNRYKEGVVARLGSLGNGYKESVVARVPTHSVMSAEEEVAVLYRF
jgi:hypothetical protein